MSYPIDPEHGPDADHDADFEHEQPGLVPSPLSYVAPVSDIELEPEPLPFQPAQSWYVAQPPPPVRTPHLGHLVILGIFAFIGLLLASLGIRTGLKAHLFGMTTMGQAVTDIHYTLGSELILYSITIFLCMVFFPMIWQKSFFAGIQWNGSTAIALRQRLFITAAICFALALINGLLLPGPTDAPIDKIFRTPGAAWLLFAFGVTVAPFFEEIVFRGFLLPALATACDWLHEKFANAPVRPLDETDQPRWSIPAMVIAAIFTSLPFAGMHAAQTGYSFGPFILLVGVSLALCWVRLSTRSLASSIIVHASYNFLLFSLMLLGTGGFKHLDKM